MSKVLPPPEMPAKQEPTDISGRLEAVKEETIMLERALAGYTHLSETLRQLQQGVPEGQRAKGLPIFNYKASSNGVNAVDVCADLRNIDPNYVPHVLSPLCAMHAQEMYGSLRRMHEMVGAMLGEVHEALFGNNAATGQGHQVQPPVEDGEPEEFIPPDDSLQPAQVSAPTPSHQGPTPPVT